MSTQKITITLTKKQLETIKSLLEEEQEKIAEDVDGFYEDDPELKEEVLQESYDFYDKIDNELTKVLINK